MKDQTKTDNHCLKLKVALRREFLDRFHPAGAEVFDACMGNGEIWKRLRPGRKLQYFGVDKKPRRGRLKIDSERVLDQPGWAFDVVDVDTYGMPWTHWLAILKHGKKPVTVFLTIGVLTMGGCGLSHASRKILELGDLEVPPAIVGPLLEDLTLEMIGTAETQGWKITELKEAVPFQPSTARYFGVRIEPDRIDRTSRDQPMVAGDFRGVKA